MNKQRRKCLERAVALLEEAQSIIQNAADEEQEYADNMPENMQASEKYDQATETAQGLEEAACGVEEQARGRKTMQILIYLNQKQKCKGPVFVGLSPASNILDSGNLEDALLVFKCRPEHRLLWEQYAWWCASHVSYLNPDPRVFNCLKITRKHFERNASKEELLEARWAVEAVGKIAKARGNLKAFWAARTAVQAARAGLTENPRKAATRAGLAVRITHWALKAGVPDWESLATMQEIQKKKLREIFDTGQFNK